MRSFKRLKYYAEEISIKVIRIPIKIRLKLFPNSGKIHTNIIPYSKIDESTKNVINKLFVKNFNNDLENHEKLWARPTHAALGYMNKKLVVLYFIYLRNCQFDGDDVIIGGLGGVVCHPFYRKFGFTRQLITKSWGKVMKNFSIDYGMLICKSKLVSFYNKFGWYVSDESKLKIIENPITKKRTFKVMLYSPSPSRYVPEIIEINDKLW